MESGPGESFSGEQEAEVTAAAFGSGDGPSSAVRSSPTAGEMATLVKGGSDEKIALTDSSDPVAEENTALMEYGRQSDKAVKGGETQNIDITADGQSEDPSADDSSQNVAGAVASTRLTTVDNAADVASGIMSAASTDPVAEEKVAPMDNGHDESNNAARGENKEMDVKVDARSKDPSVDGSQHSSSTGNGSQNGSGTDTSAILTAVDNDANVASKETSADEVLDSAVPSSYVAEAASTCSADDQILASCKERMDSGVIKKNADTLSENASEPGAETADAEKPLHAEEIQSESDILEPNVEEANQVACLAESSAQSARDVNKNETRSTSSNSRGMNSDAGEVGGRDDGNDKIFGGSSDSHTAAPFGETESAHTHDLQMESPTIIQKNTDASDIHVPTSTGEKSNLGKVNEDVCRASTEPDGLTDEVDDSILDSDHALESDSPTAMSKDPGLIPVCVDGSIDDGILDSDHAGDTEDRTKDAATLEKNAGDDVIERSTDENVDLETLSNKSHVQVENEEPLNTCNTVDKDCDEIDESILNSDDDTEKDKEESSFQKVDLLGSGEAHSVQEKTDVTVGTEDDAMHGLESTSGADIQADGNAGNDKVQMQNSEAAATDEAMEVDGNDDTHSEQLTASTCTVDDQIVTQVSDKKPASPVGKDPVNDKTEKTKDTEQPVPVFEKISSQSGDIQPGGHANTAAADMAQPKCSRNNKSSSEGVSIAGCASVDEPPSKKICLSSQNFEQFKITKLSSSGGSSPAEMTESSKRQQEQTKENLLDKGSKAVKGNSSHMVSGHVESTEARGNLSVPEPGRTPSPVIPEIPKPGKITWSVKDNTLVSSFMDTDSDVVADSESDNASPCPVESARSMAYLNELAQTKQPHHVKETRKDDCTRKQPGHSGSLVSGIPAPESSAYRKKPKMKTSSSKTGSSMVPVPVIVSPKACSSNSASTSGTVVVSVSQGKGGVAKKKVYKMDGKVLKETSKPRASYSQTPSTQSTTTKATADPGDLDDDDNVLVFTQVEEQPQILPMITPEAQRPAKSMIGGSGAKDSSKTKPKKKSSTISEQMPTTRSLLQSNLTYEKAESQRGEAVRNIIVVTPDTVDNNAEGELSLKISNVTSMSSPLSDDAPSPGALVIDMDSSDNPPAPKDKTSTKEQAARPSEVFVITNKSDVKKKGSIRGTPVINIQPRPPPPGRVVSPITIIPDNERDLASPPRTIVVTPCGQSPAAAAAQSTGTNESGSTIPKRRKRKSDTVRQMVPSPEGSAKFVAVPPSSKKAKVSNDTSVVTSSVVASNKAKNLASVVPSERAVTKSQTSTSQCASGVVSTRSSVTSTSAVPYITVEPEETRVHNLTNAAMRNITTVFPARQAPRVAGPVCTSMTNVTSSQSTRPAWPQERFQQTTLVGPRNVIPRNLGENGATVRGLSSIFPPYPLTYQQPGTATMNPYPTQNRAVFTIPVSKTHTNTYMQQRIRNPPQNFAVDLREMSGPGMRPSVDTIRPISLPTSTFSAKPRNASPVISPRTVVPPTTTNSASHVQAPKWVRAPTVSSKTNVLISPKQGITTVSIAKNTNVSQNDKLPVQSGTKMIKIAPAPGLAASPIKTPAVKNKKKSASEKSAKIKSAKLMKENILVGKSVIPQHCPSGMPEHLKGKRNFFRCVACNDCYTSAKGLRAHFDRRSIHLIHSCLFCSITHDFYNRCTLYNHCLAEIKKKNGDVSKSSLGLIVLSRTEMKLLPELKTEPNDTTNSSPVCEDSSQAEEVINVEDGDSQAVAKTTPEKPDASEKTNKKTTTSPKKKKVPTATLR